MQSFTPIQLYSIMSTGGFIPPPPDDLIDTLAPPGAQAQGSVAVVPQGSKATTAAVAAIEAAAARASALHSTPMNASASAHASAANAPADRVDGSALAQGLQANGSSFSVEAYEAAAGMKPSFVTPMKAQQGSPDTPSTYASTPSVSSPFLSSTATPSTVGEKRDAGGTLPSDLAPDMKRAAIEGAGASKSPHTKTSSVTGKDSMSNDAKDYTLANYPYFLWEFDNVPMMLALFREHMELKDGEEYESTHLERIKTLLWLLKPTELGQLIQVLKRRHDTRNMSKNEMRDFCMEKIEETLNQKAQDDKISVEESKMEAKSVGADKSPHSSNNQSAAAASALLDSTNYSTELASDRYAPV